MSTVYVTQLPHRRDPDTQSWSPTVNLAPANEFGMVRILMPPQAAFQHSHGLLAQLSKHLRSYSLENGDSLLPLGDCVVIAAACAVLARKGAFAVLRYDRLLKKYLRVIIERTMDDGPEETGGTREVPHRSGQ